MANSAKNTEQMSFSLELPPMTLGQRLSVLLRVDKGLLGAIVSVLLLGLVVVSSSSISLAEHYTGDAFHFFKKHLMNIGISLFAVFAIWCVPLAWWAKLSRAILLFGLATLLAVFIPGVGIEVNGATRWIDLGFYNLQATEVAKFCLLLYIADYLVRRADNVANEFKGIWIPCLVLAAHGALIAGQPDLGSLILLAAVCFAMLFIGGMPLRWVVLLLVMLVSAAVLLTVTEEYRLARVMNFFNPSEGSLGGNYQAQQAAIAIGRGGWFGVGLGNSMQKMLYVPEVHTDYAFSVFAEEFGFVGVLALIGLFVWLIKGAFNVAAEAARKELWFGAYASYGVAVTIALNAILHIAVNVGLAPSTGSVLPFMSYGGSSLLVTAAMCGLLLRTSVESRAPQEMHSAKGKRGAMRRAKKASAVNEEAAYV